METNETKPIRIAVFDDNQERLDSVRLLIEMQDDMICIGTFPNALNTLNKIKSAQPDIVLMDIEMPGISGIEAVRIIKETCPEITIIMQTVFEDEALIFEAIKAGASGYILKNTSPDKIIESIIDAHHGGGPMTPSIAYKVLKFFQADPPTSIKEDYRLTTREKEILALLATGMSYKMIADKLSISYHTVNAHLRHTYEKLRVNSLGEAVAKAIKERLV